MRRIIFAALCAAFIAGCGGPSPSSSPSRPATPPKPCIPPLGAGTVGSCTPRPKVSLTPSQVHGTLVPDVSGYQGCPAWPKGVPGVIFKVYEGGWHQDPSAACNAHRLRQIGAWSAAYTFLRPGSCVGQADTTVAIVRGIGGVSGPVVADAEVPLPPGFVSCFVRQVAALTHGPVVTYTAPGTWAGGPLPSPLWVATYGPRPGCVAGVCSHVAWQFTDKGCAYGLCGDLSLDSGILALHNGPTPAQRKQLYAAYRLRAELRADLARHGGSRGPATPKSYRAVWRHWISEGRQVNALIGRLHAEGV